MTARITLTDREAEFMNILWERGACTVTEVCEYLPDDPAYTTVLTILRNLEGKGYVGATKDSRAHRYAPLIERDAARKSALADLTGKLFAGSSELLMSHLIAGRKLTANDLKRIRELLEPEKRRRK
jgi:BlaI family transcriptional regulator, penicillinase repressor